MRAPSATLCVCCRAKGGTCVAHLAEQIVDVDELDAVISRWLNMRSTEAERVKARCLLIRRLRHPEVGAHPEKAPPLIPRSKAVKPVFLPPACVCQHSKRGHDEMSGECGHCECGYYEPAPDVPGHRRNHL